MIEKEIDNHLIGNIKVVNVIKVLIKQDKIINYDIIEDILVIVKNF